MLALLMLVILAWTPAIGKGVAIYFKLQAGDLADLLGGGWVSIDPSGFLSFIEMQRFFVFSILAIIGAGLIATDRRDNGLSLYFSRPLGLRSYVGGKAAIILFYYFMVTLFPAWALCLYSYWIAPDANSLDLLLLTPLRLLLFCVSTGLSISLVLLAFSSLGTRSIFVMVWWTIMVMGTEVIATFERLGSPFELLFVDDGSNDGTHDTLERVIRQDPRIRALRHARRANCANAAPDHARRETTSWVLRSLSSRADSLSPPSRWRIPYRLIVNPFV